MNHHGAKMGCTRALSAALALFALSTAAQAHAIPAFARKYGMSCTACHEAWPKLNAQGWAFRDNGYQWLAGKDSPIKIDPAYWPIAFRTTPGYLFNWQSNVPYAGGLKTVRAGQIGVSGVDMLFGGTLTDNVTFLFTYEPFLGNIGFNGLGSGPEGGYWESAFVRFDNLFGTPFLNIKVGRGALDVPFDEHRSMFIFQGNATAPYHFHPFGSKDTFELGSNVWQLSLEGHNDGSTLRYAISYVNSTLDGSGDPFTAGGDGPFASPGVYAHVQYTMFPMRKGLAQFRAGLFGFAGSEPLSASYTAAAVDGSTSGLISANGGNILPNSGYNTAAEYREGIDLDFKFNEVSTPIDLRLLGVFGQVNKGFTPRGVTNPDGTSSGAFSPDNSSAVTPSQDALWFGATTEIDWTPVLNFTAAVKYDFVRNLQQVDPSSLTNHTHDVDNMGISLRYQLDIIPRTGTALMVEADRSVNYIAGAPGGDGLYGGLTTEAYTLFGGLDFAF